MGYAIRQDVLEQINALLAVQQHYANNPQERISDKEHLKDIVAACEVLLSSLDA